jgi:signal transduction histidine kinase
VLGSEVADVELLLVEGLPLRRSHTRVHEVVMRTLDLFGSQAKSNAIDIAIERAEDVPPVVLLDSEKIAWVLSTLVGNALRYARSHVAVKVRWDEDASDLVIDVNDDGPGMPPDRARWLFARDPRSGKSAGVALLMVFDIMAAHRGSIGVQRREGHGTTFTVRIPRIRVDAS